MVTRYPYKNINDTLARLIDQVYDSMPYACEVCPVFDSPRELFYWLKRKTIFRRDPAGIELLQTMPTLFDANRHGLPGAGDCDCFTITALACLKANGYDDVAICLRGRDKHTPVHIYPLVAEGDEWVPFDLTNPRYGQERHYPYIQILPV